MPIRHPDAPDAIVIYRMNQPSGGEPDVVNGFDLVSVGDPPAVLDSPFGDGATVRDLSDPAKKFENTLDVAAFKSHAKLSIGAWVKPTVLPGIPNDHSIVALWNGGVLFELSVRKVGLVLVAFARIATAGNDVGLTGAIPIPIGSYSHLGMSYDGALGSLYVGGNPDVTDAADGAVNANGTWLNVGKSYATSAAFPGYVADLAIYAGERSASWFGLLSTSPVTYSFVTATAADELRHKIYPMIIRAIRDVDRSDGDYLLKRWTEGLDSEWARIWFKVRELETLLDPERCPSDAIEFLGWIVGLSKALEGVVGGISEADYRQLIAIAVRMWKKKGSGVGLVETLSAISGYSVRYLTWFFFRIILGEFELGWAELDVDPWLLDQPGFSPGVVPDGLDVYNVLDGTVLPSAADPAWTYVSTGLLEGATFSIAADRIVETQSANLGGLYYRDDPAALVDPTTADLGARIRIDAVVDDDGHPWMLQLEDGVAGYRLRFSSGSVVLHDSAGNLVAGPRSRAFLPGEEYRLRIFRTSPTTVDVTIDDASVFGEIEVAEFAGSIFKRYQFGYFPEAGEPNQDWTISWRDVGPRPILRFDLSTLLGLTEAVPHSIRVVYLERFGRTTPSYWTGSRNEVSISDALGASLPLDLDDLGNFRVGVDPDENVSDLRIVDDGTLDRGFVARLVAELRPAGERIFLRFVDFQDTFRNADLRFWELVSGTVVPLPDDGRAELEDGGGETVIHADMPLAATWAQFTLASQFALRDEIAGAWGETRFNVQDELNFYAVRVDPGARTVALDRVVAGVRVNLFTHGPMDVFYPGVLYMTHVTTEDVLGGVLMKVYFDGNYLGEATDPTFAAGTVGLAVAAGQNLSVSFVDLVQCPFASARVGPSLEAPETWNQACAVP